MQIGFTLFLVIDALDGFVDADGFIRQRNVLHLQAAKFTDSHPSKQCNENASSLPIQVHVDTLNKSLLLIFGERYHFLDTQFFWVLYQVPVEQWYRPFLVGILHSKTQYKNHISYGLHSETAGLIQPSGLVEIRYVALNKRGLLNKVFSNINGNIYPTVYLSEVADFLQGLTYSPSDVSVAGYLVLRSSNIQNGVLSFDDCVYVDKKVDESLQVKCDDVIMCVRNGSKKLVGKTALIPNNMAMTTWGAFMMIIRSKLNDTYIFHYLNSQMFFSQVFKDMGTATINQITKGILNECKLPLPPETARKQISKMLSSFDVKIQNAEICLTTLVELKKALLQQLFI